jgi:hypothetical protein
VGSAVHLRTRMQRGRIELDELATSADPREDRR